MKANLNQIETFLKQKKIALVGASRNEKKFGSQVLKHLIENGFEVHPVHPETDSLQGIKTYHSIEMLPDDVQSICLLTNKNNTDLVLAKVMEKGIKNIWIQQFSETPDTVKKASDSELNIIIGRCIFMYTNPKGVHLFHQRLNKLFRKFAS